MMSLEMLPAFDGDCLLLTYGQPSELRYVLIDGGRVSSYPALRSRLIRICEGGSGKLELLVCTHIDADHIGGLIKLAGDTALPITVDELWFNGFDQIESVVPMGMRQADHFSDLLLRRGWHANQRFERRPAMLADRSRPVTVELPGGLRLTLLSPDQSRLDALGNRWNEYRAKIAAVAQEGRPDAQEDDWVTPMSSGETLPELDLQDLASGPEHSDTEIANGSSIAFLAEFDGARILAAADAHPDLLSRSIKQLELDADGRLRIDLLKVAHHGSAANTTRDLVGLLSCSKFAISTDGVRHPHPDPKSIAKLLADNRGGTRELHFNYHQERTDYWNHEEAMEQYLYVCRYPASGSNAIVKV